MTARIALFFAYCTTTCHLIDHILNRCNDVQKTEKRNYWRDDEEVDEARIWKKRNGEEDVDNFRIWIICLSKTACDIIDLFAHISIAIWTIHNNHISVINCV